MLVVKVFVNDRQIDEVWIHNEGVASDGSGLTEYSVKRPRGVNKKLTHERSEGYRPLLAQALRELHLKNVKTFDSVNRRKEGDRENFKDRGGN
jgi:hypothetical protein